jgi:hypothetical protein
MKVLVPFFDGNHLCQSLLLSGLVEATWDLKLCLLCVSPFVVSLLVREPHLPGPLLAYSVWELPSGETSMATQISRISVLEGLGGDAAVLLCPGADPPRSTQTHPDPPRSTQTQTSPLAMAAIA